MDFSDILKRKDNDYTAIISPDIFRQDKKVRYFSPEKTLQEILDQESIPKEFAIIHINGVRIPMENFDKVRPNAGTLVTINAVPMGGGGKKSPLRTVLGIALAVAAGMASGFVAGALGGGLFGKAMGYLAGALVSSVGALIINAIAPPPTPKLHRLKKDDDVFFIEGARNRLKPFGTIPVVLGKHRMTPPYAARPFTETVGNHNYFRAVFLWGYGPVNVTDLRIGETPITEFEDVEIETVQGYPSDPPLTLFPQDVYQENFNVPLEYGDDWVVRTTQPDTTEIEVDITFYSGLVIIDPNGKKFSRSIDFDIQFAPTGTNSWSTITSSTWTYFADRVQSLTRPTTEATSYDVGGIIKSKYLYKRIIHGITLNSNTGDILVFSGSETVYKEDAAGTITDFGTANDDYPTIPDYCILLAWVTSNSGDTAYSSSNINYVRDSSLIPDVIQTTSDFQVTAGTSDVTITSGNLKAKGTRITGRTTSSYRASKRFIVPSGQYDVRIKRLTGPASSYYQEFAKSTFTALKSFNNTNPIQKTGMAMTAVRIRATDQLNGTLDTFNGVVESIVKDWDGTNWVERPSSNPAALYRHVLQGPANERPLTDDRLDLAKLQYWSEQCTANNREYNFVLESNSSVTEVLRDIASAGRASPSILDSKYTVVIDEPKTTPVQIFTPRNTLSYNAEKTLVDEIHGWRARFLNRNKGWRQDELIIYDDGYDKNNATKFERLELIGITDPDQIWKDGRYHIAVLKKRPERHIFTVDFENLICSRGDLVLLTHDVPLLGLGQARVVSFTDDGVNITGMTCDDGLPMDDVNKSYGVTFRDTNSGTITNRQIVTSVGFPTTVQFTTPFPISEAPAVGSLFAFGEFGQETIEVLIHSIVPQSDYRATITAVDYAPEVFTADTGTIPTWDSQITGPTYPLPPVPNIDNVISDESVLQRNLNSGILEPRIKLTMSVPPGFDSEFIQGYEVQIKESTNTNWDPIMRYDDNTSLFIDGVEQGISYDIRVRSYATGTRVSDWRVIYNHTVVGKTSPPPDVDSMIKDGSWLRWTYSSSPIDLAGFKVREKSGNDITWSNANPVHGGLITSNELDISSIPLNGLRTFMVKAVDLDGNESVNPSYVIVNLGDYLVANVLETVDYKAKSFPGTITNGSIESGTGDLVADVNPTTYWDTNDSNPFWGTDNTLFWSQVYYDMTYEFTVTPNYDLLGSTLSLDETTVGQPYTIEYKTESTNTFWVSDDLLLFWDSTDTNTFWEAGTGWTNWSGSVYTFNQPYYFRISTGFGSTRGRISKLKAIFDVQDLTESLEDVIISSSGTRLNLTTSFRAIKNVQITLQDDGGTGVNAIVIDKNKDLGPLIEVQNSSGTSVSGLIDAVVQGY